jgi:hypothetical protein
MRRGRNDPHPKPPCSRRRRRRTSESKHRIASRAIRHNSTLCRDGFSTGVGDAAPRRISTGSPVARFDTIRHNSTLCRGGFYSRRRRRRMVVQRPPRARGPLHAARCGAMRRFSSKMQFHNRQMNIDKARDKGTHRDRGTKGHTDKASAPSQSKIRRGGLKTVEDPPWRENFTLSTAIEHF